MQIDKQKISLHWIDNISYICMASMLLCVLFLHVVTSLTAGLLIYHLISSLALIFKNWLPERRAKFLAMLIVVGGIIFLLLSLAFFCVHQIRSGDMDTRIDIFLRKIMIIVDQLKRQLPFWADKYLPETVDEVFGSVAVFLRSNLGFVQVAGQEVMRSFTQAIIGMMLGVLVALDVSNQREHHRPLVAALLTRIVCLAVSFRRVVLAQIKISIINTILTGFFLLIVLPRFNVFVPLAKTLVILTFFICLLPVIGNLFSNTLIICMTLSISFPVTLCALGYLIFIHKIEYILHARIVGGEVAAKTWELLIAMLIMEAAFGLGGMIVAPVYYAYLKRELKKQFLV